MSTIGTPRHARARVANASRFGATPETIADLQRDLRAANLAKTIRQQVEQAPPLTDGQKAELAAILLAPAGGDA